MFLVETGGFSSGMCSYMHVSCILTSHRYNTLYLETSGNLRLKLLHSFQVVRIWQRLQNHFQKRRCIKEYFPVAWINRENIRSDRFSTGGIVQEIEMSNGCSRMPKVYINCPVSRALTEPKLCDTLYTTRFKSVFTVFRESVFYVVPDVNQSMPRFAQWLKRHTRVELHV